MEKFIKNAVFFAIFFIIVYFLLIVFSGRLGPSILTPNIKYKLGSYGHMNSRIKEINKTDNIDILILGSSKAYRGYDTRVFKKNGIYAFNLGSSAQTPIQTRLLLNRYLDKLNPKLIIYEISPNSFLSDGVESSLDLIANAENDIQSFRTAAICNNIKVYNTLIYGVYRDVFDLNSGFKENKIKGNDTYISGGFVEKELLYYKYAETKKWEWLPIEYQLSAFKDIISIIKERDIKLILVNAPVTLNRYNSCTNCSTFDSIMSSYGNYYDFNEIMVLDDSLNFYDSGHLNLLGVELFNERLIASLKEDKVL